MPQTFSDEEMNLLQEALENLSDEEVEVSQKDLAQALEGKMNVAALFGFGSEIMERLAEHGYMQLKRGNLEESKKAFQCLSFLDHKNYYYPLALGAVYQKQEDFLNALSFYEVAIEMNPACTPAYVGKADCFYKISFLNEALQELETALKIDPDKKDPWAQRAAVLYKKLQQEKE